MLGFSKFSHIGLGVVKDPNLLDIRVLKLISFLKITDNSKSS